MKRVSIYCLFIALLVLAPMAGNAEVCVGTLPTAPPAGHPCSNPEVKQLNFGTVVKPSGSGQVVIRRTDGQIDQSQTTLTTIHSFTEQGRSKVKGANGSKITLDFVGSSGGGLTLKNFDAQFDNTTPFMDNGMAGTVFGPYDIDKLGRNVDYGATLVIDSTATPGMHAIPYEIRMEYNNCSPCNSAPITRVALVNITQPLTVTNGTDMNFRTVLKPSTPTSVIQMQTNGTMAVISGDAGLLTGSAGVAGTFQIQGTTGAQMSVNSGFASGPPGLALSEFRGKYNGTEKNIDSAQTFIIVPGVQTLAIGAKLTITRNSVTAGTHHLTYQVNIGYE